MVGVLNLGPDRDIWGKRETDVASASTCNIGASRTIRCRVTGTTTITAFDNVPLAFRMLRFAAALTLTHNGTSLILPGGANITTAAGDTCFASCDASGNWRITNYHRGDGGVVAPYVKSVNGNTPDAAGNVVTSDLITLSLSGVTRLIASDETDGSEHSNSTSESASLKTISLPANDYEKIKIDFIVRNRVEQDANTRSDFTWRIKVGGSTVRTFVQRVIANSTTSIDSGGRDVTTVSVIIDGGQSSNTSVTITCQHSASNSSIGSLVHAARLWGIGTDEAFDAIKGEPGDPGEDAVVDNTSVNSAISGNPNATKTALDITADDVDVDGDTLTEVLNDIYSGFDLALSAKADTVDVVLLTTNQNIGGDKTFDDNVSIAGTFSVTSTSLVTNLNADYLDGQHGSYYLDLANATGTLDIADISGLQSALDGLAGGVKYQGTWNASTNSPTIPAAASGNAGHYYRVATAGTTSVDGIAEWAIGDWIISNGIAWQKVDNTESVVSVAGLTGTISAASLKSAMSFATVATSGSYNDLSGLPTLGSLSAYSSLNAAASGIGGLSAAYVNGLGALATQDEVNLSSQADGILSTSNGGTGGVYSMGSRNYTKSTSSPSGGSDGDIWDKYS